MLREGGLCFVAQEQPAVILANHGEKGAHFLDIQITREATSSQEPGRAGAASEKEDRTPAFRSAGTGSGLAQGRSTHGQAGCDGGQCLGAKN